MTELRRFEKLGRRAVALATAGILGIVTAGCSEQSDQQREQSQMQNQPAQPAADREIARQPASKDYVSFAMSFPTGQRASSDLLVEETVPREARVGQEYTSEIRVTNLRDVPLSGIVLQQRIPDNLQVANESGAKGDRMSRIDVGVLRPNESKRVQFTGTPIREGSIDTCLTAIYNPATLCSTITAVAPAVSITATGPSQADICQDLRYRFSVTNPGTGTAHHVIVEGQLPQGLTTTDGKQTFTGEVGDLAAGQSKFIDVNFRAQQSGSFTMQALATSDDAGRAQAQAVATQVLAPRLRLTVVGPKDDYLGQDLAYRVTVKNDGDTAATNTRVRLGATPGSVTFVGAQNAEGAQLSQEQPGSGASVGNLAPGESRSIVITYRSTRGGELTMDATAEANCAKQVTTPVVTRILTVTASAVEVTHDPDPVRVGQNVVYHIVAQNKGSAPDHNISVTVKLPDQEQFVRAGGASTAAAQGQTITFAAIPELAPKQSMRWDLEAKAVQVGDVRVQFTMTSDANKTTAVKEEPTKLYGGESNIQERTNVAPPIAPAQSQPAGR